MASVDIQPSSYPQARRDESVTEDIHGKKISDPYRYLENPDGEETQKFVDQLNSVSRPFLDDTSIRAALKENLTKLWDYEKYGTTSKHGELYYTFYNSGLQNQSVLYQSPNYKDKGKVFFDVNKLSEDGTTAIRGMSWTDDGKYLAISLSEKGSDFATLKVIDKEGNTLPDIVENLKFSGQDWLENEGIIYSKYPSAAKDEKGAYVKENKNHSLYYHKFGSDQSSDFIIADSTNPDDLVTGFVSEDGTLLFVEIRQGCDENNRLYYYDLVAAGGKIESKLDLKPLFDKNDASYNFIINDGEYIWVMTDKDAPMFKVIKTKITEAHKGPTAWEDFIPADPKKKLQYVVPVAGDKLIVVYLEDVHDVVDIVELSSGKVLERLQLGLGTVSAISGRRRRSEVFFSFESHLEPSTVYRLDFEKKRSPGEPLELEVVQKNKIEGLDSSQFDVKQVFYPSKDGTKIPMFILYHKSVKLNGDNPTILYGYGGFNIGLTPGFSITTQLYLRDFKSVYAIANLRGGNEYGEEWHQAAKKEKKQNVFDDFHAAAEYLIKEGYTSPSRLAISGGSNGGLLVAVCSQQRPDLYAAAINRVGVMDMLRFHKFTIGAAWTTEYGNPDNAEDFEFIYKYSPLHNIRLNPQHQWPSTLLMTADHDDRVVPSHTLKYAAQLYHVVNSEGSNTQRNPLLVRVDVKAGHGAGKPTSKVIDEYVDIFSFLHRVLRMNFSSSDNSHI